MKTILTLLLVSLCFMLSAQTKVIAHKSHSGKMNTLVKNTEDNFGLNPSHYQLKVDSIERISPTMLLFYKQAYRDEGVLRDSVFLNTNPSNIVAVLDSLKKVYPDAKFKGFDTSVRSKKKDKSEMVFIFFNQTPSLPLSTGLLLTGMLILGWYLNYNPQRSVQSRPDAA